MKKAKLNSKGFGHLELLLVIVVIVAIAGAGFLVYEHGNKTNVAHAGGQTTLQTGMFTVTACRTYVAAYGGVNEVKFTFSKAASLKNAEYQVFNSRTDPSPTTMGTAWWNNVVASLSINQSTYLGDKIGFIDATGVHGGASTYTVAQVNKWATC
jgi:hypothetical protein